MNIEEIIKSIIDRVEKLEQEVYLPGINSEYAGAFLPGQIILVQPALIDTKEEAKFVFRRLRYFNAGIFWCDGPPDYGHEAPYKNGKRITRETLIMLMSQIDFEI